jgi:hypothetical protein
VSTALLALAVVAGLACPAHMWWRMRRGERAACCPPGGEESDALAVQRREQALRAQLANLDREEGADGRASEGYAVRP